MKRKTKHTSHTIARLTVFARAYYHKYVENLLKVPEKCTKFENILQKDRWLHVIIARNKLPAYALLKKMSMKNRSEK